MNARDRFYQLLVKSMCEMSNVETKTKLTERKEVLEQANERQRNTILNLQEDYENLQVEYDTAILEYAHITAYLTNQTVSLRTRLALLQDR